MASLYGVTASVLVCGAAFDGVSEEIAGPTQIVARDGLIAEIGPSVNRPEGAAVIDLSERSPGFIDTHVHLTMDASDLARPLDDIVCTAGVDFVMRTGIVQRHPEPDLTS